MSLADDLFINMCKDIIDNGYSTEGEKVRPKWEDGTYAYTIKRFGVVNRYDLSKEFPAITLRKTYVKSAIDELLWIWQKKSNNVHDLKSHIWDSWADENGSIGKAYGYQLGVKHKYKEGMMDQVDRLIYDLKNNPYSRRMLTNIYVHQDLSEMNLISVRVQHDIQCNRGQAQRYTESEIPGCACGQQLECCPVCGTGTYACPGHGL